MIISWESLNEIKFYNLQEIRGYLVSCIDYRKDEKLENGKKKEADEWNSARETAERRFGDCEDISILASYLAEKIGYEPRLLILEKSDSRQAICLLKKQTTYGIRYGCIDYETLINPQYASLEDLVKEINLREKRVWNKYRIFREINLSSVNFDWTRGAGNLLPCFEKYLK